jgi:hypothetical protein
MDVYQTLRTDEEFALSRARRGIQVARDTVNQRWHKISPKAPPVAMLYFAVEDFAGDVAILTPGFKPYKSPNGERGWIIHGPRALSTG